MPGSAVDLRTGWDLSERHHQVELIRLIQIEKPSGKAVQLVRPKVALQLTNSWNKASLKLTERKAKAGPPFET